jgi:hypothetical protein
MKIIDVHIHVGHRHEWTNLAKKVWMDTGLMSRKYSIRTEPASSGILRCYKG